MNTLPNKSEQIIFDACIFMMGITDPNYNFCNIKNALLDPWFEYFDKILIHEYIYNHELDANSKKYIDEKINIGKAEILHTPKHNIQYDSYLYELENHDLLKSSCRRKNAGEIHSIAYAKLFNIPYFSTNDYDATVACNEIKTFNSVEIIGLEKLFVIVETTLSFKNSKKN